MWNGCLRAEGPAQEATRSQGSIEQDWLKALRNRVTPCCVLSLVVVVVGQANEAAEEAFG